MIVAFVYSCTWQTLGFFSFLGMQFYVVMYLSLKACKTKLTVDIYSRYLLKFRMFHFTNWHEIIQHVKLWGFILMFKQQKMKQLIL